MATGSWPTISDVASRMDPSGDMHVIAEMLSQSIALTKDLYMVESSEMFGHEFSFRTSKYICKRRAGLSNNGVESAPKARRFSESHRNSDVKFTARCPIL